MGAFDRPCTAQLGTDGCAASRRPAIRRRLLPRGWRGTGSVVSTAVAILATPHRIAKYMPSLWGQFYDSGTTRGQFDASTGRVCVEVSDWHGHTRLQCQNPMGALVEVCVRSDRAEYVSHDHVACVSDGAPACRYEVQFER